MRVFKKTWCLLTFCLSVIILLQASVLQKACIDENRKYYNQVAIINTNTRDVVFSCTDEEVRKKVPQFPMNHLNTKDIIKSYLELSIDLHNRSNVFLRDIREENSDFTIAYFSGSKYKSIYNYS